MDQGVRLVAAVGDVLCDPYRYRRLVGKLNYLTNTRPDIVFLVSVVSPFMSTVTQTHWEARSPSDKRYTTGYYVFVGGNLVSSKSKKQGIVARSSAGSEYRAMAHVASEITWV
ncbi:PREDICTED: uncharacterized protein LOC109174059 [Ipomoea nil]|uniref:uncharacterized protein LOC109174059 n=1 Tax=Ipomoea nil TaxID=35883 RepID=UPI0009013163|nr:PREDICTED: uncharacterized protein LOC109174059 [Ipomoea nil]